MNGDKQGSARQYAYLLNSQYATQLQLNYLKNFPTISRLRDPAWSNAAKSWRELQSPFLW